MAGILVLSLMGCNQSHPKDPNTNPDPEPCPLQIDDVRSNSGLDCNKSLDSLDQIELVERMIKNHGITCSRGDTVKLSNLTANWDLDGKGGWKLSSASCTIKYHTGEPQTKQIGAPHSVWLSDSLLKKYCDLGESCESYAVCEECSTVGIPCEATVKTTGIIIAVVSDITGG